MSVSDRPAAFRTLPGGVRARTLAPPRLPALALALVPVLLGAVLAVLAVLAVAARADDAPAAPAAPRPVISEIVSADPTRQRAFPGSVEAKREAALAFQTIGRVSRLDVAPGDVVKKDDVLATLDRVSLQEDLRAAEAALSSARAEAAYAAQSYSRTLALAERDIASQAQVEQALANRDATAARVAAAEADLAAAQEALTYGSLTAPMDGVVVSTEVEAGSVVSAGTPVLTLAALAGLEAVIDVPSEFLAVLPEDARFELRRHAGGDEVVPARLRLVEPVADQALRGRRLRLAIEGSDHGFRIGTLVSATYAAETEAVITLPRSAVAGTGEAPAVWRVVPDPRRVTSVPVRLGSTLGDRVEIRDGIDVGDEVIVKGAHSLEEGQPVGERAQ